MPDGTTHSRATLALALIRGITAYQLGYLFPQVVALSGGALAGLVLNPDSDANSGNIIFLLRWRRRYIRRLRRSRWK